MMNYTPGPWFADLKGNIWRRHPSELYQNGGPVAGDKPIAVVHQGWYKENEEGYPVESNSCLIAAAPELLETLSWALQNWDEHQQTGYVFQGDWVPNAREIIAKILNEEQ